MENKWNERIDQFIQAQRENILRDIGRLVAVPSVEGPAAPGAPFGPGPRAALDEALAIAAELGLAPGEGEGHIGWADVPGAEKEKYLATITHLDVVPEGNGWDADPFTLRVRDGWLLGRGVADDKGPSVLCLYALKFLKDEAGPLRYPVRALLGCNEETNMKDVAWYNAHEKPPVFCFTPDAEFPLCNGEKGQFEADLLSPVLNGDILDFEGGVARNAVPDRASALIRAELAALPVAEGITLEQEAGGVRVRGWGKSGHAAMPQGTVNAIGLVVDYLLANGIGSEAERAFLQLLHKLHSAWDGTGLGIQADDGLFDPLTVVGGVIRMENGALRQTVDCRFPTSTNGSVLEAALRKAAGDAGVVCMDHVNEPFYIGVDAAPIQALMEAYCQVTGEEAKPFTMGGGTYARHFPLAVSFGPENPNAVLPDFAGPMHGANEGAKFEHLLAALKIYILALLKLEELEY